MFVVGLAGVLGRGSLRLASALYIVSDERICNKILTGRKSRFRKTLVFVINQNISAKLTHRTPSRVGVSEVNKVLDMSSQTK